MGRRSGLRSRRGRRPGPPHRCATAAIAAIDKGANSVIAVATHGVLSGEAIERLDSAQIDKIIITDTIFVDDNKQISKMHIVSVADVFGEAIKRIHRGESVSALFNL